MDRKQPVLRDYALSPNSPSSRAVSLSGGMDSVAALIVMLDTYGQCDALATGGDTDHPASRRYRSYICSTLGVHLSEIDITGSFEHFQRTIRASSSYLSAFTAFYERQYHRPVRDAVSMKRYQTVAYGYRREEKQAIYGRSKYHRVAPVYEWSKLEIRNLLLARGLELHPCYSENRFLGEELRESSWIDASGYGLFHLADSQTLLHPDVESTVRWLNEYHPGLFKIATDTFPTLSSIVHV
jgi:3'-phosphoadenosine 5'-phosphosulfate sulfotransferase (PAPS reductase)/FAD synthetase